MNAAAIDLSILWPALIAGLLVIAKKRPRLKQLHEAFRNGLVEKRYLALVKGRWRNALQNVRLPLHKYHTAEGERRVRVDEPLDVVDERRRAGNG